MIQLINDGTIGGLLARLTAGREDDQATIAAKTYFVAAALVEQGIGVAVMDGFTARAFLSPELDLRPLAEAMRFDVVASHLQDHPLSTIARQFLVSVSKALAASQT